MTDTQKTKTKREKRTPRRGLAPWMTPEEAAKYLALSTERSLRDIARRRLLPAHRLGRTLRFSRPEVDAAMVANRQATIAEVRRGGAGAPALDEPCLGPFLTPEQAAAYLKLSSAQAVNVRAYRGQIPVYRIGDRILRYRACELDAALLENDPRRPAPDLLDDEELMNEEDC